MYDLLRFIKRLARILNWIAGWSLIGMTALTCADVILRAFRRPILGTYEIVGFLGAVVIAFALAETTVERGHVAVEVLVTRLPLRIQGIIYLITHLLGIFLFLLIAYECWSYGNDLKASGEVSLTLKLPFFPILYGISVSALVVCLILLGDIFLMLTRGPGEWYHWEE
ncbi:MAG TPA: TRAP transporter small permease [Deltaproteobacteria bacterium]|nr:TRAP transporter small permease [Deltaproteobacteria bacterium]